MRIFVSHSSKDLDETKALCAALKAEAGGAACTPIVAFEVLADYENLVAGTHWPRQLHEWLARCHAGVILLTANALESDWVLKEATILSWRLCLDRRFRVFVVTDPAANIGEAELKKHRFGPLSLTEIQWVRAGDPVAAAKQVLSRLDGAAPPTPLDNLIGALTDLFGAHVGPQTLRRVAERLHVEPPAWDPARSDTEQYIEAVAIRLLNESLGGFKGVQEIIGELSRTVQVEPLRSILDFLAPYWVDAAAAGRLRALGERQSGAAGLNGAEVPSYTGLMYIRRAHQMAYDYVLPEVSGGHAGRPADEIGEQICAWFRTRRRLSGDDAAVRRRLALWPNPIYVILPEPLDRMSLAELRAAFPTVVFILPTGEQLRIDPALEDVEWLEPELDLERETMEMINYYAAVETIANKELRR